MFESVAKDNGLNVFFTHLGGVFKVACCFVCGDLLVHNLRSLKPAPWGPSSGKTGARAVR